MHFVNRMWCLNVIAIVLVGRRRSFWIKTANCPSTNWDKMVHLLYFKLLYYLSPLVYSLLLLLVSLSMFGVRDALVATCWLLVGCLLVGTFEKSQVHSHRLITIIFTASLVIIQLIRSTWLLLRWWIKSHQLLYPPPPPPGSSSCLFQVHSHASNVVPL